MLRLFLFFRVVSVEPKDRLEVTKTAVICGFPGQRGVDKGGLATL